MLLKHTWLAPSCATLAVAAAAYAVCYVPVTVDCKELSTLPAPGCRACEHDPNCCDTWTSSGNVTHHTTDYPPGGSGNTNYSEATACNYHVVYMTCSTGGYCVELVTHNDSPIPLPPVTPNNCSVDNPGT
jgi:hypothetical protein